MSTTEPRRGLFITFEGMDASGKTTQMHLLAERLQCAGHDVIETVEPGGTPIGDQIRAILLDPANQELSPTAEMLLYFASRAQNVDERIVPALRAGTIVLCDRFTDSTLAYQGIGRGLGEEPVLSLDRIACRGLQPDLTIFVDIDLATSAARKQARSQTDRPSDRMDDQAAEFHRRVRDAYLHLAAGSPHRFVTIDGRGDVETVAARIWEAVQARLQA